MRLEYINKHTTNEWVYIGDFETLDEVYKSIKVFWIAHNFEIPYYRMWIDDDGSTHIDFGSHSQFYRIIGDNEWKSEVLG